MQTDRFGPFSYACSIVLFSPKLSNQVFHINFGSLQCTAGAAIIVILGDNKGSTRTQGASCGKDWKGTYMVYNIPCPERNKFTTFLDISIFPLFPSHFFWNVLVINCIRIAAGSCVCHFWKTQRRCHQLGEHVGSARTAAGLPLRFTNWSWKFCSEQCVWAIFTKAMQAIACLRLKIIWWYVEICLAEMNTNTNTSIS